MSVEIEILLAVLGGGVGIVTAWITASTASMRRELEDLQGRVRELEEWRKR